MKHHNLAVAAAWLLTTAAFAHHGHHDMPAAPPAAVQQLASTPRWTQQPLLLPGSMARGERAKALLQPVGLVVSTVTVFAPEGPVERLRVDYPVGAEGAWIEAVTPKIGNYHWVIAREEHPDLVRVASTAWYFGNPGASPKALLEKAKHELEIIPAPLPREHSSYRESEKWRFLVRFKGQPLAHHPLTLETEFGSRATFYTDASGFATVLFPRDFRPAAKLSEAAHHRPRRAQFVLFTEKSSEGRRYLTAFNHTYQQDTDRDKSLGWGAAFGLLGMLAATPLLRRRGNRPVGDDNHA